MELKTLQTFQQIVKWGSFIQAARELNYAQSTVTMQIQKLESELGITLFHRGKELSLTEAGRLFYEQSAVIVRNMEQLQTSLSEMKLGEAGHIRLGATEPAASWRLPGILGSFMSAHPNIRISVDIAGTLVLTERILKGETDFAICTAPEWGNGLYFEPLFQEEFVVYLPEEHPLAGQERIEPEDLQGYRLLITSATCPYRRKLEMVMQERGSRVPDTMEVGSMTALKHYVEHGLGIALIPKILAAPEGRGATVRAISDSLIHMSMGILCKESAYPLQLAAQRLYRCLKEELAYV